MPAEMENHCPFGCRFEDLDGDTGYCRHLVGFTNDPKVGGIAELLQRVERKTPDGRQFHTHAQVTGKKIFRITKECSLINPDRVVNDPVKGIRAVSKMWLSTRVYHPTYKNLHFLPPDPQEPVELPELVTPLAAAQPERELNPYAQPQ